MNTTSNSPRFHEVSKRTVPNNSHSGLLILAGMALCVAAIPAFAQDLPATETAPETGYTVPRGVATPIVMKTLPNAACDLHTVSVTDAAHSLRINANGDGYFKVHVTPRQESVEGEHMQIDCTSAGKITTYLLHLRASDAPTSDMPAPQTVIPPPSGSKVLPALTGNEAQSVSREELLARGYPPRPDAGASPDLYVKWLNVVSRPIVLLPSHGVAHSEISHQKPGVEESPANATNSHWSGFVAREENGFYYGIQATWNVPEVEAGAGVGTTTYSGYWVGLDGYPPSTDVEQAGTEQDLISTTFFDLAIYYAWTELVPAQPSAQEVMSVNAGDSMYVSVWIGDSGGAMDVNGAYVWYYIYDSRSNEGVITNTALNSVYASEMSAEWIMERPYIWANSNFALLSNYHKAFMTDAYVLGVNGYWVGVATASDLRLTSYNDSFVGTDNNELSSASLTGPASISFDWHNFH
ncbi:MAG: G1 family glutamic endopeptidase [Steroidobacteraceae bacterium]